MRLDLYSAEGDLVTDFPANDGFDPLTVWALLSRLQREKGIKFTVTDVSSMRREDLDKAYASAVVASVWNRYRIRKIFGTNSSSALFFGKGVPALLVYEAEKPIHVVPHEEPGGAVVTIRKYLESLSEGSVGGRELVRHMDELRKAIGPIGIPTAALVREGRRR